MLLRSGVGVAPRMKKRNRGPGNSTKSWIWERGRRGEGVGDRGAHRGRPALAHLSWHYRLSPAIQDIFPKQQH